MFPTARILVMRPHHIRTKPRYHTSREPRSSLGYFFISPIFERRRIHVTHGPQRASLDTEPYWYDWKARSLEAPSKEIWFWNHPYGSDQASSRWRIFQTNTNGSDRTMVDYDISVTDLSWSKKQALNFPSVCAVGSSHAEVNAAFGNDPQSLPGSSRHNEQILPANRPANI